MYDASDRKFAVIYYPSYSKGIDYYFAIANPMLTLVLIENASFMWWVMAVLTITIDMTFCCFIKR